MGALEKILATFKKVKEDIAGRLKTDASNLSGTLTTAERNIILDKISSSYRFNPRYSLYRITTFPTNTNNGTLYMTVYNAYTVGYQAVLKTQFSSRFNNFRDTKVFPFERTTDIRCAFELWDNGNGTSSLYLRGQAIYPVKLEIHRNEAEFPILIEKVGDNAFIPSGTLVTDTTGLPELYLDNQSDALISNSTQATKDKWKTALGFHVQNFYKETDFDFQENTATGSGFKIRVQKEGKLVTVQGKIQINGTVSWGDVIVCTMPSSPVNLRPIESTLPTVTSDGISVSGSSHIDNFGRLWVIGSAPNNNADGIYNFFHQYETAT